VFAIDKIRLNEGGSTVNVTYDKLLF
jgi:hypothetical protein